MVGTCIVVGTSIVAEIYTFLYPSSYSIEKVKILQIHTHTHIQSMQKFSVEMEMNLDNTYRDEFICHLYS